MRGKISIAMLLMLMLAFISVALTAGAQGQPPQPVVFTEGGLTTTLYAPGQPTLPSGLQVLTETVAHDAGIPEPWYKPQGSQVSAIQAGPTITLEVPQMCKLWGVWPDCWSFMEEPTAVTLTVEGSDEAYDILLLAGEEAGQIDVLSFTTTSGDAWIQHQVPTGTVFSWNITDTTPVTAVISIVSHIPGPQPIQAFWIYQGWQWGGLTTRWIDWYGRNEADINGFCFYFDPPELHPGDWYWTYVCEENFGPADADKLYARFTNTQQIGLWPTWIFWNGTYGARHWGWTQLKFQVPMTAVKGTYVAEVELWSNTSDHHRSGNILTTTYRILKVEPAVWLPMVARDYTQSFVPAPAVRLDVQDNTLYIGQKDVFTATNIGNVTITDASIWIKDPIPALQGNPSYYIGTLKPQQWVTVTWSSQQMGLFTINLTAQYNGQIQDTKQITVSGLCCSR